MHNFDSELFKLREKMRKTSRILSYIFSFLFLLGISMNLLLMFTGEISIYQFWIFLFLIIIAMILNSIYTLIQRFFINL